MILQDSATLQEYLHYGYLPSSGQGLPFQLYTDETWLRRRQQLFDYSLSDLVIEGVGSLRAAMAQTFDSSCASGGSHIIPLSGGLDSRAILAWFVENVDKSVFQTVTFGSLGTWDFEIGRLIAEKTGVRNETIDLSKVEWRTEELVSFACLCEAPLPIFEAYLFHLTRKRFGKNQLYWSGFMGDALTGAHLPPAQSISWGAAKSNFVRWNRFVRSVTLNQPGFTPEVYLPAQPHYPDPNHLDFDDQLDFTARQQCYIKPLVLLAGYHYCTPFLSPEWVRFILLVSRALREKQYLYREILKTAYPKLFSLPTKTNYGLPLDAPRWRKAIRIGQLRVNTIARRFIPWLDWGAPKGTNYIDFNEGIRQRADLKQVVLENIQDLKTRGIVNWIDFDGIWRRHQNRQANHADALTLLASLEINLKASEKVKPANNA